MKETAPKTWQKVHLIALAIVLMVGVLSGAKLFPTIREVPVDRIVEKRVEVPVDRIVEKRVEVPVDRVVEKIVEKRIEVPVEKTVIKYVSDRTKEIDGKPLYMLSEDRLKLWMQVKPGMTRQQVIAILGPPTDKPNLYNNGGRGYLTNFHWGEGSVLFEQISEGGLAHTVRPPEY
jgi:SmpA / OmlA family